MDYDFEDFYLNTPLLPMLVQTKPKEALAAAFQAGRDAEREAQEESQELEEDR